jgi:hypothetical protein
MKSNEDRLYIKIIELNTIYKFVVDNYFIWDHLKTKYLF